MLAAPVWDQMIQDELPQLAERGFTQWLEHPSPGGSAIPAPACGPTPSTTRTGRRRRPSASTPTRSSRELGLTDDEIAALATAGVI